MCEVCGGVSADEANEILETWEMGYKLAAGSLPGLLLNKLYPDLQASSDLLIENGG